ncbi:MAG: hypothetical protein GF409_07270 [Candidatus Omnitrophica bacterium]|nr:hypothetical protein [Candidatus Omnitrophota bacterium]
MSYSMYAEIAGVPVKLEYSLPESRPIIRKLLKDFLVPDEPEGEKFLLKMMPSRGLVRFALNNDEKDREANIISMNVGSGHIDKNARFAVVPDASDQSPEASEFILDNFLRICFQYVIIHWGGIILHSSAVVKDARAMVFIAPNSGGKSTIASNTGCHVLSDDCVAVRKRDDGTWMACATPWGKLSGRGSYPIEAMFFIDKSDRFYCRKMDAVQAVKGLFSNASLSFPEMAGFESDLFDDILGLVTGMGSRLAVYRMGFRKDDNVIELLKEDRALCG